MTHDESEKAVEEKRVAIEEELKANEALWEKYQEYREHDVLKLIDSYALDKARLQVHGNYTHSHHKYTMKEWSRRAWFGLAEIQSKKLFDLQCRWRAKEIELEGFRTSFEFEDLPTAILDVEVIPPISEEELDDYIRFLSTPNGIARHYDSLRQYQHHESIKSAHHEDGYMPEFYEYHYTIKGNTGLLSLPNLIGNDEDRLIEIATSYFRNKNKEIQAKKQPAKKQTPKWLSYYNKDVKIELAKFLGEKDVAGFIKDLSKWVKEKPELEVSWAMEYLSLCYPEPVPMPAAPTWQEAIERAALEHITLKVQESLPAVYEEYLVKKQLGTPIGYIDGEHKRSEKPIQMVWMEAAERIEKGEEVSLKECFETRMWD